MKFYDQILTSIRSLFGMSEDATEQEVHQALSETETREALEQRIREELQAEYETQIADLNQQLVNQRADFEAEMNQLELRIQELEAEPAADHTSGETEMEAAETLPSWMNDPINQRVRKMIKKK